MSNSQKVERKLAAIMFTDIAGYTALSAKDSTKSSELLKTQRELLKPIVEKHGGSWMKEMGDGLLLTFDSATSAVECSIAIQKSTKEIDGLNLRIGIHEGEVIKQDGDVLGDDVNVAARIEPFSAEGGVAISDKIYRAISSNKEFETKFIGTPELKGVTQEVKVYCITSHGLPETDISKVSAKLELESKIPKFAPFGGLSILIVILFFVFNYEEKEKVPSIAIIPLENKGESKDDFYSYGISADLISDVSRAGDIRVASLKDIEKFDYTSLTNEELAKKLFVRYISQGTLWKVDSIFQLSLELYDTKKEKIQWSKNWQKNWSDLPDIKGHLSENILNNLNIEIKQNLTKTESVNAHAYELYLKAKNIYEKRDNNDDTIIARELLNKALELDNNLISAKNLLGKTYIYAGDFEKALRIFHSNLKQAEKIGEKHGMSKALNGIGVLESIKGNYVQALEYYEKSLKLRQELGDKDGIVANFINIGNLYGNEGDYEKTLSYYNEAYSISEQLDDKSGMGTTLNNIGVVYGIKGDYDKALDYYKKSLSIRKKINDNLGMGYNLNNIGIAYFNKKNYNEALKYLEQSLSIQKELYIKDIELPTIVHLYLIYKYYGMDYDQEYLNRLLSGSENFEMNFRLYFLLENKSFLEDAYNQIQKNFSSMEKELGKAFLGYPLPKAIVEEWNKINK